MIVTLTSMTSIRDRELAPLLRDWRSAMILGDATDSTLKRRLGTYRRFSRTLGRPAESATPREITTWLAYYATPATRYAYHGDLNALYTWLFSLDDEDDEDLVMLRPHRNPMLKVPRPKNPRGAPRPVPTDLLFRGLYKAIVQEKHDLLDCLLLGAYAGERVEEQAHHRGEYIQDGMLLIPGKGGVEKWIPCHPLIEAIASRRPRNGFWFPSYAKAGHIHASTITRRVAKHFEGVGLRATPHQLRHWSGTWLLRMGADLRETQEWLRHADVSSTQIYTQVEINQLQAAMMRLPVPPFLQHLMPDHGELLAA